MLTRRQFISRAGTSAAALFPFSRAARVPGPAWPGDTPARPWGGLHPAPALRWRGESAASLGLRAGTLAPGWPRDRRNPSPPLDWTAVGASLRRRFPDLRRHLIFEYYPWYASDPWIHWNLEDRTPPADIAANYMPALGPYDSRDTRVIEQHARWIAESGAGAINISWWGRDSFEDRTVSRVMNVMRDHDIHVTFHLEPYKTDRVFSYVDDVEYLLRTYGDQRGWDCFLLLEDADGRVGPVFKSFRTIVPPTARDCRGIVSRVPDYVPDQTWRRQTDTLRERVRRTFDRITLLADVSDTLRMATAGFDGMALYDPYVLPSTWRPIAEACSTRGLAYSFQVTPGFDGIEPRRVDPDSCYSPRPITPPGDYDWSNPLDRERAAHQSQNRIAESVRTSIGLQVDDALADSRLGFFLVYIVSFNEWHEGTQFEPMLDAADLSTAERAAGYHNPSDGEYRLDYVTRLLDLILGNSDTPGLAKHVNAGSLNREPVEPLEPLR